MRHDYPVAYGYPVDVVLCPMVPLAILVLAYYRGSNRYYFRLATG